MADFVKKPLFVYVVIVFAASMLGIFLVKDRLTHSKVSDGSANQANEIANVGVDNDMLPSESEVGKVASTTPESSEYMNYFTSEGRTNTSNIVGYIAGGAFVVNLVDWIPQKWNMKNNPEGEKGLILFTPKETLPDRDFSDISFRIITTSEEENAFYLAEKEMKLPVDKDTVRTSGVIESNDGNMDIQYVEKLFGNSCEQKFFFDGNNSKTAIVTFSAASANCQKYSARVKEFIRGFSNGVPRG